MYDLAIIGAGWAGFNAARKAKALGLEACLIEKEDIGGTCLNRGCIPTKTFIQSAKVYSSMLKTAVFGIEAPVVKIDFLKVQERKEKIILQLRQGMEFMLKGSTFLKGEARVLSSNEIGLGEKTIQARNIIIATGSRPLELPGFKFDGKKILSSDDALNLKEVPGSLLIIGGGVIGCEFASLFSLLGAKVTVVELMPQLLPGVDPEIAKKLESLLRKRGVKVMTATDASALKPEDFSRILVSVGRAPCAGVQGLEKAGVKVDKGRVLVDTYLRTNIPNIYAAGDCTGKTMLAHFAAYQGEIACENISHPANLQPSDNTAIPDCIFTCPEIASVGLSEEAARKKGLKVKVYKFDFLGSGMARILDEAEGFVKIVCAAEDGCVLGAGIIGPKATELIGILTPAVSCGLKAGDLRKVIFAHPTLSESISEALR